MLPYYDTSPAVGLLLLIILLIWCLMEAAQYSIGRQRAGARRVRQPAWWAAAVFVTIAANAILYLAPRFAPAAAIRPAGVLAGIGLAVMAAGAALRRWSFAILGTYFTFDVQVSSDQPVIIAGPYRVLRHPSYTGILLICAGVGLAGGNWAGLAGMVILPAALLVWRIRVEERALLDTLDDRYRSYAQQHKRLIPLVW